MATTQELTDQIRELQAQWEALRVGVSVPPSGPRLSTQRIAIHLPKFTRANPHLWFAQVERSFRLHGINEDFDKFDLVTVQLEEEVLLAVEDLVACPPASEKYEVPKKRLLEKFAESPESKLRRLLQGGGTAGLKPSESIRPLLTVWEETDLHKLAKIADKMLEAIGTNTTFAVASTPPKVPDEAVNVVAPAGASKNINDSVRLLTQKVDSLQNDIKRLQSVNRSQNRPRSRTRSQSPGPGQPSRQTDGHRDRLCYYHQKFGDAARKCRPPCTRSSLN
ncbi:PREDICTED: uncharacterized protein LOC108358478 [Rhagoletis zephyria]|uniref:uncharacterized protein LOC108358478 n=1 Tax=Rhagoletis zephyria TaxID=28612 RepID=UPI000811981B|nr:PREDICTED: uncharacterized protein LOC108358478 [Rhagoletis zephyria]